MKAVAGVDIGSLTAKAVLLDLRGQLLSYCIVAAGMVNRKAAQKCLTQAVEKARLKTADVGNVVSTGYGRSLVKFGDRNITEISCHARGAHWLMPHIRMVIDIGGQDSKAISVDSEGRVFNFAMNDKCAAGTGRFLEVMATALGVELEAMGSLSLTSTNPAQVSSLCTVFAESEIISLSARGCPTVDIIAGLHEAIGRRVVSMVKGVGIHPPVMMSGGVAKNQGVVRVLSQLLKTEVLVPDEPQIVGALGAAIFALEG